MEISTFVIWGIIIGLILYAVMIYNNLVRLKHNVSQAWSNIDVLMKQRHNELPKLVETCKQYMKYEKDVLEKVTEARASVARARRPVISVPLVRLRVSFGLVWATYLRWLRTTPNLKPTSSSSTCRIEFRRSNPRSLTDANSTMTASTPIISASNSSQIL